MKPIPRKKIDHTTEHRITLGEYERQLAQDALTMNGIRSASIAASGLAQGLGLIGALGIGALLWGKDLEDVAERIVGIWPESGSLFSPEWIAKWGDDPVEETEEALIDGDNDEVDGLDPVDTPSGVQTLFGKSPYEVYSIAASGRANEYAYSETQILINFKIKNPSFPMPPAGSFDEGLIIAGWYRNNPAPPDFLLLGQVSVQTNIRVTCAKINLSFLKWLQNQYPTRHPDFVDDPLLDWVAYVTIPVDDDGNKKEPYSTIFNSTPKVPYNYILKKARGEQEIAAYAFWSAPLP